MRISDLDTKSPQDEGSFMHLAHTKYGHLMYTGPDADPDGRWIGKGEPDPDKAVGVMVRGMEGQTVQKFTLEQQRKALAMAKKPAVNQPEVDHENGLKFACVLITEFVNLEDEHGEPLQPTNENKRAFVEMSDDISRQLLQFSRERENFFKPLSSD